MKIEYIDNDKQHGIKYDWKFLEKEFKKLNIPTNVYNPFKFHKVGAYAWTVDMSERSTGKTTNWLLLGMIMNKYYDTQIIYVRELIDMIMPKHARQLFKTIIDYGYVEKITDGKYNAIEYKSRAHYYTNTETGETANEPFCVSLSIDDNMLNKSSFNAPRGDLIIFDEFISKYNYMNEFVEFADTLKTVIRERDSAIIVCVANTIDKHNNFFRELGIYDAIQKMDINEKRIVENAHGSKVDVALIGTKIEDMPEHRKNHNARFFGFANPKLNAIRGGEWAIPIFPHIPKNKDGAVDVLIKNRYIEYNGYLVNLELVLHETMGLCVYCHKANKTYDDSIIYSINVVLTDKNYKYGWGVGSVDKKLLDLYNKNRYYYATNEEGQIVDAYIRDFKMNKRG